MLNFDIGYVKQEQPEVEEIDMNEVECDDNADKTDVTDANAEVYELADTKNMIFDGTSVTNLSQDNPDNSDQSDNSLNSVNSISYGVKVIRTMQEIIVYPDGKTYTRAWVVDQKVRDFSKKKAARKKLLPEAVVEDTEEV